MNTKTQTTKATQYVIRYRLGARKEIHTDYAYGDAELGEWVREQAADNLSVQIYSVTPRNA